MTKGNSNIPLLKKKILKKLGLRVGILPQATSKTIGKIQSVYVLEKLEQVLSNIDLFDLDRLLSSDYDLQAIINKFQLEAKYTVYKLKKEKGSAAASQEMTANGRKMNQQTVCQICATFDKIYLNSSIIQTLYDSGMITWQKIYERSSKVNIEELEQELLGKLNLTREDLAASEVSSNFVSDGTHEYEENFEDVSEFDELREGAKSQVLIDRYERNSRARSQCIDYYGTSCYVCHLDLGSKYGRVGKGLIHIHHIKPLHTIGQDYIVDPIKDLIPVCPNCHAIIHRQNPPYKIEDVQAFLREGSL